MEAFIQSFSSAELSHRLGACERLKQKLQQSNTNDVNLKVITACVNLLKDANVKVVMASMECVQLLIQSKRDMFQQVVNMTFYLLVPKTGDTKNPIREKAKDILTQLVDTYDPPSHIEKLAANLSNKNVHIKATLLEIISRVYNNCSPDQSQSINLCSKVVALLNDTQAIVRQMALETLLVLSGQYQTQIMNCMSEQKIRPIYIQQYETMLSRYQPNQHRQYPSSTTSQHPIVSSTNNTSEEDFDLLDENPSQFEENPQINMHSSTQSSNAQMTNRRASTASFHTKRITGSQPVATTTTTTESHQGVHANNNNNSILKGFSIPPVCELLHPAKILSFLVSTSAEQSGVDVAREQAVDIQEERDLIQLVDKILLDLQKVDDWQRRVTAMQMLQSILWGNIQNQMTSTWSALLRKLVEPLGNQLTDLRSLVSKESCKTIALLAFKLPTIFSQICLESISSKLTRLLQVKIQVMATAADRAYRVLLLTCQESKTLQQVSEVLQQSRASQLRAVMVEYLILICCTWKVDILEKHIQVIASALQTGLSDSDPQSRKYARVLYYLLLTQMHPTNPLDTNDISPPSSALIRNKILNLNLDGHVLKHLQPAESIQQSVEFESAVEIIRNCRGKPAEFFLQSQLLNVQLDQQINFTSTTSTTSAPTSQNNKVVTSNSSSSSSSHVNSSQKENILPGISAAMEKNTPVTTSTLKSTATTTNRRLSMTSAVRVNTNNSNISHTTSTSSIHSNSSINSIHSNDGKLTSDTTERDLLGSSRGHLLHRDGQQQSEGVAGAAAEEKSQIFGVTTSSRRQSMMLMPPQRINFNNTSTSTSISTAVVAGSDLQEALPVSQSSAGQLVAHRPPMPPPTHSLGGATPMNHSVGGAISTSHPTNAHRRTSLLTSSSTSTNSNSNPVTATSTSTSALLADGPKRVLSFSGPAHSLVTSTDSTTLSGTTTTVRRRQTISASEFIKLTSTSHNSTSTEILGEDSPVDSGDFLAGRESASAGEITAILQDHESNPSLKLKALTFIQHRIRSEDKEIGETGELVRLACTSTRDLHARIANEALTTLEVFLQEHARISERTPSKEVEVEAEHTLREVLVTLFHALLDVRLSVKERANTLLTGVKNSLSAEKLLRVLVRDLLRIPDRCRSALLQYIGAILQRISDETLALVCNAPQTLLQDLLVKLAAILDTTSTSTSKQPSTVLLAAGRKLLLSLYARIPQEMLDSFVKLTTSEEATLVGLLKLEKIDVEVPLEEARARLHASMHPPPENPILKLIEAHQRQAQLDQKTKLESPVKSSPQNTVTSTSKSTSTVVSSDAVKLIAQEYDQDEFSTAAVACEDKPSKLHGVAGEVNARAGPSESLYIDDIDRYLNKETKYVEVDRSAVKSAVKSANADSDEFLLHSALPKYSPQLEVPQLQQKTDRPSSTSSPTVINTFITTSTSTSTSTKSPYADFKKTIVTSPIDYNQNPTTSTKQLQPSGFREIEEEHSDKLQLQPRLQHQRVELDVRSPSHTIISNFNKQSPSSTVIQSSRSRDDQSHTAVTSDLVTVHVAKNTVFNDQLEETVLKTNINISTTSESPHSLQRVKLITPTNSSSGSSSSAKEEFIPGTQYTIGWLATNLRKSNGLPLQTSSTVKKKEAYALLKKLARQSDDVYWQVHGCQLLHSVVDAVEVEVEVSANLKDLEETEESLFSLYLLLLKHKASHLHTVDLLEVTRKLLQEKLVRLSVSRTPDFQRLFQEILRYTAEEFARRQVPDYLQYLTDAWRMLKTDARVSKPDVDLLSLIFINGWIAGLHAFNGINQFTPKISSTSTLTATLSATTPLRNYQERVLALTAGVLQLLLPLFDCPQVEVRKASVFLVVELYLLLSKEVEEKLLVLPEAQRQLVMIYVDRRLRKQLK